MEASIARQMQSVRSQSGVASDDGFFSVKWTGPPLIARPPAADCPPLPQNESEAIIKDAADAQNLDPALIRAVIRQESGFRPCAVSEKGAMGLMQLMPQTAAHFQIADPFNAVENVKAGAQLLKQLMDRFRGDLRLTLAAYNAGPGKVGGDQPSIPDIPETQNYVDRILNALAGTAINVQEKAK